MSKGLIISLVVIGAFLFLGFITISWGVGHYNKMVSERESVEKSWSDVENVYQRRADLIPNLVATVKGYANHELNTLVGVIEQRANATKMTIDPTNMSEDQMKQFQANQGELSQALSRLMVSVEAYPNLKANENFMAFQAQLEGTENRIAVERRKFNDVARVYNTHIRTFPANIIAGIGNFQPKPYFQADESAKTAPKVQF